MSGQPDTDAFLEGLLKSGLLSRERLAALVAQPPDLTGSALAESLIAGGDLTRFQADCLLDGFFRGFLIGDFKVLDMLGGGGMGLLYLARHRETGAQAALKVLSEIYKHDAAMRARFKIEARAGMRLCHPNLLRVHELGQTEELYGDVPFINMEFVRGIELQELVLLRGSLPWPFACDLIRQAAAGLHHAHEAGFIHRDVKPANLLVDETGVLKLLDFGLALDKAGHEDELSLALIFGQHCLGTDDYISPEQIQNSSGVDRRADIYSLGCTLYFALTGKLPFPGKSTAEKLERHRTQPPRDVRELAADVPQSVVDILERMLAKQPERRFATCAQIENAVTPFSQQQPIEFDYSSVCAVRKQTAKRRAAVQNGNGRCKISAASRASIAMRLFH